ncbi:mitochondrial tRNA-specific 2-thiouridylase 1 [Harmonia axyridis]|uniref:mitochondrial tRNA-specific 2-thiouridylase 1 n=1 Tax=Harmonia axyridis TaxID=115357 RepID=UPI001E279CFE|nr:mitochondrial tRNA-specific 2-thiouridylase 1 [Harmonia axyridis]
MIINRVAVAVSGGVDSAVAALLLKLKGFTVEAVFMENWDIADEKGFCSSDADYADAVSLCETLKIKLHKVNFVKHYWNEVFCEFIKDYQNGITPNPDILCNRQIKFNYLHKYALNDMKADALATGHYARTSFGPFLENYSPDKSAKLLKARDAKKDQIFFLSQVEQMALKRTMFPLGNYLKSEVKTIAQENDLEKFAKRKESMGICFIGTRDFQDFIGEYIEDKQGDFVDIDTGKIVGQHKGLHQWTLGQRTRLPGFPKAYYTARKHLHNNAIILGSGTDHPFLYTKLFFTSKPHWITEKPKELQEEDILECDFKFQHSHDWVPCTIFECPQGLIVHLNSAKRAVTPGQYAVFCRGDECLGSARIINTPISEFCMEYVENSRDLKINKQ